MMIFKWLILIVIAIGLVKYAIENDIFYMNKSDHKNNAFEILKKSYARGESNRQEYKDKKRKLGL